MCVGPLAVSPFDTPGVSVSFGDSALCFHSPDPSEDNAVPFTVRASTPNALQNDALAPITVRSSAIKSNGAFDEAINATARLVAASGSSGTNNSKAKAYGNRNSLELERLPGSTAVDHAI